MNWIKIISVGGPDHVNLDLVNRIVENSALFQLSFYYNNSAIPVVYTFANLTDYNIFVKKLESISTTINIDELAPQ